jgi:hypothetical protein
MQTGAQSIFTWWSRKKKYLHGAEMDNDFVGGF